MRVRPARREAFGIIELIVILGIIGLLVSIFLPSLCAAKERANRVKCASNLRQIGQGLMLYANNNKGAYPRIRIDPAKACGNGFSGAGAANPFGEGGPEANDPTAVLFMLIREADLNPEVFVCPSSNQEKDTLNGLAPKQRSSFAKAMNLSYSVHNPYPRPSGVKNAWETAGNFPADWAIAADRNDGEFDLALTSNSGAAAQKKMNSSNHEQEGQNVLYNDGHVEWATTAFAGDTRDNIYTSAKTNGKTPPGQCDPAASSDNWPEPQVEGETVLVPKKGRGF